jgi:hypothetical protein
MTWRDILNPGRTEGRAMHVLKLGTSIFGAAIVAAVLASPVAAKNDKNDKKK